MEYMTEIPKKTEMLFHPLWAIILYLLMAITTFHEKFKYLSMIHIESLTLSICVILTFINFKISKKESKEHALPIILLSIIGFIYLTAPVITSIVIGDNLDIIQDGEYQTLLKMIVFAPCFLWMTYSTPFKYKILNAILVFYLLFGIYFLYRFKFLHEIREIDQRPSLRIRHGDANFLSTFFSMIVPLGLMQFHHYYFRLKKMLTSYLFLIISLFLMICSYLTQSRMGFISLFIGLFYLLTRPIWHFSRRIIILVAIIISVGAFGINSNGLVSRFNNLKDKSNIDRILSWKNGLIIFSEHPFFGIGLHQAKNFYYQNSGYPSFKADFKQLDVHNTFLKIAAELGYLGLGLFLVLFTFPLKYIIYSKKTDSFFLFSSYSIITLASLTTGIGSKDLFIFQLFLLSALAIPSTKEIICK